MPDVDYYALLGVAPNATHAEIKSAYRALARSMHPDTGGTAGTFRLLRDAYDTLSDPDRRGAYDSRNSVTDTFPVVTATRSRPRRFGEDPDFIPTAPRVDPASIPWWHTVDRTMRTHYAQPGSPGHAPGVATAGAVLLPASAVVLSSGLPAGLLIVLLLLLAASLVVAVLLGRRHLAARRDVRAFHDEFGDTTVFGAPGTDRDQIGERLTADLFARYLTRLPGVRVFHGLAWPDSVFADVDHAVLCGSRLVLVESKLWLPGHYAGDGDGGLLRNGQRFRGGGTRLADSVEAFRRLLPQAEIRGVLIIYPSRAGAVTTEPGDSCKIPPMTAEQFVHEIGFWLAVEPTTVERDVFRTVVGQVVG